MRNFRNDFFFRQKAVWDSMAAQTVRAKRGDQVLGGNRLRVLESRIQFCEKQKVSFEFSSGNNMWILA